MNNDKVQAGWHTILLIELRRIWLGWGGPLFLFAFSLGFSIYVFALAADPEIHEISQHQLINQTIKITIFVGMIVVLILGANSFSGERDQNTLESLLLTPVPRWQLAIGKFLAPISLWLGMIMISIPYIILVGKGTEVIAESLILLIISGTLLIVISAGIGIFASGLSPTNLVSISTAVGIVLLLALPILLPSSVKELPILAMILATNPITAVARYQSSVIGGTDWATELELLISPLISAALAIGLVPYVLNKKLSLLGGFRA